jgi:hypothetical protein
MASCRKDGFDTSAARLASFTNCISLFEFDLQKTGKIKNKIAMIKIKVVDSGLTTGKIVSKCRRKTMPRR